MQPPGEGPSPALRVGVSPPVGVVVGGLGGQCHDATARPEPRRFRQHHRAHRAHPRPSTKLECASRGWRRKTPRAGYPRGVCGRDDYRLPLLATITAARSFFQLIASGGNTASQAISDSRDLSRFYSQTATAPLQPPATLFERPAGMRVPTLGLDLSRFWITYGAIRCVVGRTVGIQSTASPRPRIPTQSTTPLIVDGFPRTGQGGHNRAAWENPFDNRPAHRPLTSSKWGVSILAQFLHGGRFQWTKIYLRPLIETLHGWRILYHCTGRKALAARR